MGLAEEELAQDRLADKRLTEGKLAQEAGLAEEEASLSSESSFRIIGSRFVTQLEKKPLFTDRRCRVAVCVCVCVCLSVCVCLCVCVLGRGVLVPATLHKAIMAP